LYDPADGKTKVAEGIVLAFDPAHPIVIHHQPVDPNVFVRVSIDVVVEGKEHVRAIEAVDELIEIGDLKHTPIPWPRSCVRLHKKGQEVMIFLSFDYYFLIRV
jgi:hypothetical protein